MYIVTTCYPDCLGDQSLKDLVWEILDSGIPHDTLEEAKKSVEDEVKEIVDEWDSFEDHEKPKVVKDMMEWKKKKNAWLLDLEEELDFIAQIRKF